jgi:hypothetical protein
MTVVEPRSHSTPQHSWKELTMAVPTFVDRVTLHIVAGRGGNGVASVHREKFKPSADPTAATAGRVARSSSASTPT